jgi:hypothetical protein
MAPLTSHNTRGTFLSCISLNIKFNHVQRHKKGSADNRREAKECRVMPHGSGIENAIIFPALSSLNMQILSNSLSRYHNLSG